MLNSKRLIFLIKLTTKQMLSKVKLPLCGLLAILSLTVMLTGCSNATPDAVLYGHPSQPDYLYLKAGQTYLPAMDEKWCSPALLAEKDQLILDLSNTLHQQDVHLLNK